jgi:hypothetical protein
MSAGLAEIIKYGPIADMAFLDWIDAHLDALMARDPTALAHAVRRSLRDQGLGWARTNANLACVPSSTLATPLATPLKQVWAYGGVVAWRGRGLRHGDGGSFVARHGLD